MLFAIAITATIRLRRCQRYYAAAILPAEDDARRFSLRRFRHAADAF